MRLNIRILIIFGLMSCGVAALVAAADLPPELLKPADTKRDADSHHAQITYKLSNGADKWDADVRDRITKAMDEAVVVYNKNGEFDRMLTANWNPGTPTADANFGGWINFGGQIGTRTALHEIAHTLGIGTAPKWREFAKAGKWTGKFGIEQLKEFDGPDAVLHCDNQHFWPYGLNYDKEGGPENFKRNVMMVTAMRADMGLGSPPHPAANALKTAREDAVTAHTAVDKAEGTLKVLQNKARVALDLKPEVAAAVTNVQSAKAANASATSKVLAALRQTAEYQTAELNAATAQKRVDDFHTEAAASPDDCAKAAAESLIAKGKVTQLENRALAADVGIAALKQKVTASMAKLDEVRESAFKNDPELVAARRQLAAAQTSAEAADEHVAKAEIAAAKEAK